MPFSRGKFTKFIKASCVQATISNIFSIDKTWKDLHPEIYCRDHRIGIDRDAPNSVSLLKQLFDVPRSVNGAVSLS